MNDIDFSKVEEKPLVKKSYNEGLDDKFSSKTLAKKPAMETTPEKSSVRSGKQKVEGWSITKDIEKKVEQEYVGSELIRLTSFLHARIKCEQNFSEGKETSVQYFLDESIPLQIKKEQAATNGNEELENIYLYDGKAEIFNRHYYKNGTFRETFFLEKESNPKEKYDMRFFTKKGEIASENGKKAVLEYEPKQVTFYTPEELNQIVFQVAKERKMNKSTLINYAICGLLDEQTQELLTKRLKETNILSYFTEDN
jgi:hypothetical protein